MANMGLTKSYTAEAAISANRFVKVGANDFGVLTGAAATDKIIGASTDIDAASGERCDVVLEGIADIKLGGTVARGDLLTADASGQGVTAAPAAGVNNRIGGMALISGVSGDVIPVKIAPSSLQG
ncbi:capsid cement protein [Bradyrhizobium sp. SZCCHNS3002]|uniref:capsid cement protein n=1 Tax=Bradyrhizobium sp. SZCCHNS3002 TaxID=3057310 RepID=UPI0028F13421|nr:capsid cement protein [Bradyrhizobium sp. SZCCHNS3002]